ncbi:MAG: hypothetical protein LBL71_04040 [Endomicrobium sp.]|nr:hypothetical protein [Endomicrobium sp.]
MRENYFKRELLEGIRFQKGALSYIGLRIGLGKTASIVNTAREIVTWRWENREDKS